MAEAVPGIHVNMEGRLDINPTDPKLLQALVKLSGQTWEKTEVVIWRLASYIKNINYPKTPDWKPLEPINATGKRIAAEKMMKEVDYFLAGLKSDLAGKLGFAVLDEVRAEQRSRAEAVAATGTSTPVLAPVVPTVETRDNKVPRPQGTGTTLASSGKEAIQYARQDAFTRRMTEAEKK